MREITQEFLSDIIDLYRRTPVLAFLYFCNGSDMEKCVLDCGAGAKVPPLALFHMHGYRTYGIDISEEKIAMAREFEERHEIMLNVEKGDMRKVEFPDGHFSFAYSYNTIFHMKKEEVYCSIGEMARVLRPGGMMFFNLLSNDDGGYGKGNEIGEGEFEEVYDGESVIHSYFGDEEADGHLAGLHMIAKQKRTGRLMENGRETNYAFIDYFLQKYR
ncbi:MAG: class I SAM-dependent methyltransferase [Candidatus Methanofastidiosa archaeon]|nr:class I SAM-dependent methyltransferase [Candidatus Methanofastidiosa archaeon]